MYKLLQKHGKKLLAVFSAVLMIAFILPTSSRYGGMGRNPIVGTVAGEKLTAQEMNSARASWDVLTHTRIKSNPQAVLAMALPRPSLMEIQAHPQVFMLLPK